MSIHRSILQVQLKEITKAYGLFWAIWLLLMMASYIISSVTEAEQFYFIGIAPVLFWVAYYSFQAVKADLYYVLKLGASRNQFMTTIVVLISLFVVGMTITHLLLVQLFSILADNLSFITPITIVTWAELSSQLSFFQSLILDMLVLLLVACFMVWAGSLYIRFGKVSIYFLAASMILALLLPFVRNHLIEWIELVVGGGGAFISVSALFAVSLLLMLLSRQVLQKASLR